jgi:thiosulfate/3-mercaptopyruvate sulfurtransferase
MLKEINALNRRIFNMLLAILFAMTATGCNSNLYKSYNSGLVVEGDELAKLLNKKPAEKMIILDLRNEDAYNKGHIAGAVKIDLNEWEKESLATETGLDNEAFWKNKIGSVGINGNVPVLIYDDGNMTGAARIWFILQYFGVSKLSVLNGGYPILKSQIIDGNLAISHEQTKPVPVKFELNSENSGQVKLMERQNVLEAIEQKESQILDTRTHNEYTGSDLRNNPRGGHLPTATNLPHKDLLDDKGCLKSPKKLAKIFKEAGFKKGNPIIIYCNTGGRASLTALAAERAGYGPVMNYYHSFKEWSADMSCPLEKPDN